MGEGRKGKGRGRESHELSLKRSAPLHSQRTSHSQKASPSTAHRTWRTRAALPPAIDKALSRPPVCRRQKSSSRSLVSIPDSLSIARFRSEEHTSELQSRLHLV